MYKLTYETPQGKQEATFDFRPFSGDLMLAARELYAKSQLPALLKPPVKTEAE